MLISGLTNLGNPPPGTFALDGVILFMSTRYPGEPGSGETFIRYHVPVAKATSYIHITGDPCSHEGFASVPPPTLFSERGNESDIFYTE